MIATYIIPADNRAAVEKKMAEMNRKAARFGTDMIVATFERDHIQTWKVLKYHDAPEYGYVEYSREWLKATVTGVTAELGGYYFRATLYHTTDGNIIASIPGFEVPRVYRNAPANCDHCRTARRRSETFLIESKDGLMQVGRSCLGDFFGANDPHRMASWAESLGAFDSWFRTLEEGTTRGAAYEDMWSLHQFLVAVAAVIRKDGWTSKAKARETEDATATVTTVMSLLGRNRLSWKDAQEMEARYLDGEDSDGHSIGWNPDDHKVADKVVAWSKTLVTEDDSATNDYLHNLSVIARAELVSVRTSGLAASMIVAWKKATQKLEERRSPEAKASTSAFVGTVGERLRDVPVMMNAIIDLPPTEWGSRQLIKVTDDAGNVYVWFTGATGGRWVFPLRADEAPSEDGNRARVPEPGDRMWITGTVKGHKEFGGIRQTELSRCALASVAPVPKKTKKVKA